MIVEYEVVDWREQIKSTRRKVLPAIAAASLSLTLLTSAAIANKDQIYGSLPEVAAARNNWRLQDMETQFLDLQNLLEPFGINPNLEIENSTISLLISNLERRGVQLRYSPEELKEKFEWLPERDFINQYVKIQSGYGNVNDQRRYAKTSLMVWGQGDRVYLNEGYIRQHLQNLGVRNIDNKTIRNFQSQQIIDSIVNRYLPSDHVTFEQITINYLSRNVQTFREISGLHPISNITHLYRFEEIAKKVVAQQLLSDLPGMSYDSYVAYIGDIQDMRRVQLLHESVSMDLNELVQVYFDQIPLSDYLAKLGGDQIDPIQAAAMKLILFSNH